MTPSSIARSICAVDVPLDSELVDLRFRRRVRFRFGAPSGAISGVASLSLTGCDAGITRSMTGEAMRPKTVAGERLD